MKYLIQIILYICLFAWVSTTANAQLTNKRFEIQHIGYAQGLNSQRVFSITEGKYAAMWFGTKMGVSRYNGRVVKNYQLPGTFYYGDMAGRKINVLYQPLQGLYAYDQSGRIYHYAENEDLFVQILQLSNQLKAKVILNKTRVDDQGNLWLATNQGVLKWNAQEGLQTLVSNLYVNDVMVHKDTLVVASSQGIRITTMDGKTWRKVTTTNAQTLEYTPSNHLLWVGTFDSGLFYLSLTTMHAKAIEDKHLTNHPPIRSISTYNDSTLLVGVDGGGIYTVNTKTKKQILLMDAKDDTNAFLPSNGVYCAVRDMQGNIWIGAYTGGVTKAIYRKYPISTLVHEKGNSQSLATDNVNGIAQTQDGEIWFATDFGISIQTQATNHWKHVLQKTVVLSISPTSHHNMWAGTYGDGAYLLDKNGRIKEHLTKQNGKLTTNSLFSVITDMDGDVWFGGLDGQLMMIESKTGKRQTYDINWMQSIKPFNREEIAVATVDGFHIVNKKTGDIRSYSTSSEYETKNGSAYIITMLFDKDNTVWLGTEGGGLTHYNMKDRTTQNITMADGLPSNDVYSIQKDKENRLWVSTGKGVALINHGKVLNLNYLPNLEKEYNKSAVDVLSDGTFVYGSTSGAVFVNPIAITSVTYSAPLLIKRIVVESEKVKESNQRATHLYKMLKAKKIELAYTQNTFKIYFEAINYRFQRDIVYQHVLKGYENRWSTPSPDDVVHYTKVTPGDYLFKVKSIRSSNGQVISENEIAIHILPPWWKTWWAWIIYVGLVVVLFLFILRYKSNQIQKEYDEEKIRFFIDTAHDIRTPVSLIKAPLEELDNEPNLSTDARYYLDLALINTDKLNTIVGQLLEFEKIDTQNAQSSFVPISLNHLLKKETDSFALYCEKKQQTLHVSLPNEEVVVLTNRRLFEILLNNLITNACKYTPAHGTIDIKLEQKDKKAVLTVQDDGIGIPDEAQKHLFVDVFRASNARKLVEHGTGFGLIQVAKIVKKFDGKIECKSTLAQGTTFVVTLPKLDEQFIENEYETQASAPADRQISNPMEHNLTIQNEQPSADRQDREYTLLIVEDHDELRQYLSKTLRSHYRVVDVPNGEKALEYLKEEYPDVILSDVMMPGIQGDELCKRVKEQPETSGIPVILLTAKSNHDAIIDGLSKGADDYIAKPFSSDVLKWKIRNILQTRERIRAYVMKQVMEQIGNHHEDKVEMPGDDSAKQTMNENDLQFIEKSTQIIIENLDNEDFSIDYLCQEMAMSRTLFFGRLKSLTDKGPQEFIRIIRLQNAAKLLHNGNSVTEAAEKSGFVNVKYFSTLFKKEFGVPPSKY